VPHLQEGFDARQQFRVLDRLGEEVVASRRERALLVGDLIQGRDEQHRNASSVGVGKDTAFLAVASLRHALLLVWFASSVLCGAGSVPGMPSAILELSRTLYPCLLGTFVKGIVGRRSRLTASADDAPFGDAQTRHPPSLVRPNKPNNALASVSSLLQ
jgi:hypothetical protein